MVSKDPILGHLSWNFGTIACNRRNKVAESCDKFEN